MEKIDLGGQWWVKGFMETEGERNKVFDIDYSQKGWSKAVVPGVVHLDLMKAKEIPEPFYRMNEGKVKWVEERDWWYRRKFRITETFLSKSRIELIFQGLDTFATIWINGKRVGQANNMFIPWTYDVKDYLIIGENLLVVKFESPTKKLERLEQENGKLGAAFYNGRVYGRKAQYSFGWDWGPRLITSGIWRKLEIVSYNIARIEDVWAGVDLKSNNKAEVLVEVEINSIGQDRLTVTAELSFNKGIHQKKVSEIMGVGKNITTTKFLVRNAKLWWPAGYGKQNLYNLKVVLRTGQSELDSKSFKVGLRKVELCQKQDKEGTKFTFYINGIPVFCKGANWVPLDSFLSRITRQDYEDLLNLAVEANMNMLRVWGGGIYESEEFYQICDERGILIWQDFMFACAEYPEKRWFLNMVRKEGEMVVKGLRNHPSLILWCGNNENDWGFKDHWFGVKKKFYGKTIYHKVLPTLCQKLDGTRPYWPSSPFGGDDPNSQSAGDRHSWDVWGRWQDYRDYEKDNGRFISEFGFQSPPTMETIKSFTKLADLHPQSEVMGHHNKMPEGIERLYRYLSGHFHLPRSFREFILLTQVNQGLALKTGIEHWRRRKFMTSGVLIWQLNDCWPVMSWSLIDYHHKLKPAYSYVKRAYQPILASLTRDKDTICIWVTNDTLKRAKGDIIAKLQTITGKILFMRKYKVNICDNSSQIVKDIEIKQLPLLGRKEYFSVELMVNGRVISQNILFLHQDRYRHITSPRLKIRIKDRRKNRYSLEIFSTKLSLAVHVSLSEVKTTFSDNYFDILPAASKEVLIETEKKVSIRKLKSLLRINYLGIR